MGSDGPVVETRELTKKYGTFLALDRLTLAVGALVWLRLTAVEGFRLGGTWSEPPVLGAGWETDTALGDLRQRARAVIHQDFGAAPLWSWKNPRTCLTLPFWQRLLPSMRYVICLRNPIDVARSLRRRNGFSLDKGTEEGLRDALQQFTRALEKLHR